MNVYFIAKSKKGCEYAYKRETAIECKSEKQAKKLADYLNNSDKLSDFLKLKEGETWAFHSDADWYIVPPYKIAKRGDNIVVTLNY